jgi:hypothetical protein
VSLLTSAPVPIESKDFLIFPNPVKSRETFQILSDKSLSEYQIIVYDSTGRIIQTAGKAQQNQRLIAPSVPGIYLVVARKQQEQLISRLIVRY